MATVPIMMLEIGANVARMQSDMRRITGVVENSLGQLKRSAMNVAGALVSAFTLRQLVILGKQALDAGDEIAKMSQRVGVSVETLSSWKLAASLADVELEKLGKGLQILSRNMLDAQAGTGEAKDAIAALGLSVTDARGNLLSGDKVMMQIADRFAEMEDGSAKTAYAMKILGKSGAELIPMLNQGGKALAEAAKEARDLGVAFDRETAQQMERVNDNFTRMRFAAQGVVIGITTGLLPTLEHLTDMFVESAKGPKKFEEASEALSAALKVMASSAYVVKEVFWSMGQSIGGWAAAVYSAATGDFKAAAEIIKAMAKDSDDIWSEMSKKLAKIWDDSAKKAKKSGDDIKKSFKPPPAMAGDQEKQIAKIIEKLEEEAKALRAGADAYEIYKKGLSGATAAQKERALTLMNTIKALEMEKEYYQKIFETHEEEKRQLQDNIMQILSMNDALKMQAITAGMTEEEITDLNLALAGAPQILRENAEAYYKTIRAARDYAEELDFLKSVIEDLKTPMDKLMEYQEKLQELVSKGWISGAEAMRLYQQRLDELAGKEKDSVSERERILLDFGDRMRQLNRFNADYAIAQIERQAAIFKSAGADETAVAWWTAQEKLKASREWKDGAIRSLQDYAATATDLGKGVEGVVTNAFRGMEDALVEFTKTGKLKFKDLIDSIITDLMRLMIRKYITGAMAGALGGAFSNWHGGGVVGQTATAQRQLPAGAMLAAPRLHNGLQPNEFPAILKRGEGVFTPEQMRAMGNRMDISISIPVTAGVMDPRRAGAMRRELEGELEPTVRRIVESYL